MGLARSARPQNRNESGTGSGRGGGEMRGEEAGAAPRIGAADGDGLGIGGRGRESVGRRGMMVTPGYRIEIWCLIYESCR